MCDLAAQSAPDATFNDGSDGVRSQGIGIGRDRERGATRKTNAGMVARAGIRVNAELLAHHAFALSLSLSHQGLDAPLLV